jgi:hypothetical protein
MVDHGSRNYGLEGFAAAADSIGRDSLIEGCQFAPLVNGQPKQVHAGDLSVRNEKGSLEFAGLCMKRVDHLYPLKILGVLEILTQEVGAIKSLCGRNDERKRRWCPPKGFQDRGLL